MVGSFVFAHVDYYGWSTLLPRNCAIYDLFSLKGPKNHDIDKKGSFLMPIELFGP